MDEAKIQKVDYSPLGKIDREQQDTGLLPYATAELTIQLTVSLPITRYTRKTIGDGIVGIENPTLYAYGDSKVLYQGKQVGTIEFGKAMIMPDKLLINPDKLPKHVAYLLRRVTEVEAQRAMEAMANQPHCHAFGSMELGNMGCSNCFEAFRTRYDACMSRMKAIGKTTPGCPSCGNTTLLAYDESTGKYYCSNCGYIGR